MNICERYVKGIPKFSVTLWHTSARALRREASEVRAFCCLNLSHRDYRRRQSPAEPPDSPPERTRDDIPPPTSGMITIRSRYVCASCCDLCVTCITPQIEMRAPGLMHVLQTRQ